MIHNPIWCLQIGYVTFQIDAGYLEILSQKGSDFPSVTIRQFSIIVISNKQTHNHISTSKSCHPRSIFSIYSQALRYRRIIINQDLLKIRLMELYSNFRLSDYPHKMINNILEKVKELPRTLTHNQRNEQPNE